MSGNAAIDLPSQKNADVQMDTCEKYMLRTFFNQGRPSVCQPHRVIYPFMAFLSFACLPAHFFSCSRVLAPAYEKNMEVRSRRSTVSISVPDGAVKRRGCDVLIYNADKYGRLDSFTHFDGDSRQMQVSSGEGDKTAVVICNAQEGCLEWEDMLTMKSLSSVCCELEAETKEFPVLVGKADFEAGEDCAVSLKPLMARICLKELSCDFRGTAYPFEEITDARVYLTNVNADCGITGDGGNGSRFINNGGWDEKDAVRFSSPEILCREIEGNVGMDVRELNLDLYCYPNPCSEESFGKPFTRLVIEGCVKGRRWYWPININGLGKGGIRSNESYSLKVHLRRSGTEDPDYAISMDREELVMEIEKWDEKENYAVAF